MKKFIITEEDKKHIIGLYEENINNLPDLEPDRLSSKNAELTKKQQEILNKTYPDLNISVDGNWRDKSFNDAVEKFIKDNGGIPSYCKTGDGYCPKGDDGVVYTTDRKINMLLNGETDVESETNSDVVINFTNDGKYDYKLSNGKYYYRAKGDEEWIDAKGKGLAAIKKIVKF
jgi:hypothetical protein